MLKLFVKAENLRSIWDFPHNLIVYGIFAYFLWNYNKTSLCLVFHFSKQSGRFLNVVSTFLDIIESAC